MACGTSRLCISFKTFAIHFTTITGQLAYVTTPDATLPTNNFLKPVRPLDPITNTSIFSRSAYSTIAPTIDIGSMINSVPLGQMGSSE